eukprot:5442429-Pleurochrysis_carterae.AAC.2
MAPASPASCSRPLPGGRTRPRLRALLTTPCSPAASRACMRAPPHRSARAKLPPPLARPTHT